MASRGERRLLSGIPCEAGRRYRWPTSLCREPTRTVSHRANATVYSRAWSCRGRRHRETTDSIDAATFDHPLADRSITAAFPFPSASESGVGRREVDCRRDLADIWAALHQKTRNQIRRAEGKYSVRIVEDSNCFVDFYMKSVKAWGRANRIEFKHFSTLFSECRSRECGKILGAFDQDGAPVAMTYLVWGHGIMYYLLSMRSFLSMDYGSISLLLWSAMKEAQRIGLIFDLDGVYSSGTARFLSGFGGQIKTRLVIRRSRMPYSALQSLRRHYTQDESQFFT